MSVPLGLAPGQVNLDDFPYEITQDGQTGWYSEEAALQLLGFAEPNAARSTRDSLSELVRYNKPIGNCRSGHLVVINPPRPS